MYYSLIHPHLCYGLLLCCHTYKTYVNQIVVLQKRAIRIVSKANWNEHTGPIFKSLGILLLEQLYLFHLGNFMFLQYRCWSPVVTTDFTQNSDIHRYNTRYANLIHVQYRRTALVANSFLNSGPKYWDSLPCYLKEVPNAESFKRLHKRHFKHILATVSSLESVTSVS